MSDLRAAWRRLLATRGVTATAIVTMALGIATTTTVFSVVNSILLRPLPYADPDRLVMIWDHWTGWPATWLSEAEFAEYRDDSRSFANVGAFLTDSRNLSGGDSPERIRVGIASAGVFDALGVHAKQGRFYTSAEDAAGAAKVAMISEGLWRRRFGADPGMVGRTILLDDSSTMVIGVMPADFQMPLDFGAEPMDIWIPLALGPTDHSQRGGHYLNVIAKLRPGVSAAVADADVQAMARRMVATYPMGYLPNFGAMTRTVTSQILGDVRPTLGLLLAAVACVLLIACANVSSLLLARAHARQREIVVRAALGAGPGRIMRELLVEGVLLCLISGVIGVGLALGAVRVIAALAPATIPRIQSIGIDGTVLAFAVVLSCATGIIAGLFPAVHALGTDLHLALKSGGRATTDRGGDRVRRVLVSGEVALSVVLLVAAGLLLKSFARLQAVDPGFTPDHVLTARLSLPAARYPDHRSVRAFYHALRDRVRVLPTVTAAGLVRVLPMTDVIGDWGFDVEGRTNARQFAYAGDWQVVSPDYFRAMGIARRDGRVIAETDDERAADVVVINETLAHLVWPNGGAVGSRIRMGANGTPPWRTVIGIVADIKHRGLDAEARPELYLPQTQFPADESTPARSMYVVVRTTGDSRALGAAIQRAITGLDPNIPLASVRTMDEVLSSWTAARRLAMVVLAALASTALLLAAVGLYGVVAYGVVQRTAEIGIRRALGAGAVAVVGLIVRQSGAACAVGAVTGLACALLVSRVIGALLFHVSGTDPAVFISVVVVLGATVALASLIPAHRATQVDPLIALRSD